MKKLLYLALAALLFSCSDNDDDTDCTVKTATFENTDHVKAGPTAKGENLYPGYNDREVNPYMEYTDKETNITFTFSQSEGMYEGFSLSDWNNKEIADWINQCSVFSGDNDQKNGGYNKSRNFLMAFMSSKIGSTIDFHFAKDNEEKIINNFYINNTTYTALITEKGNTWAQPASYENKDYVKLIIEGFDASGKSKGTTEVYLADYRVEGKGGILKEWTKVNTQHFGKVHQIKFMFDVSDNLKGPEYINTPAYFCIDDVTVIDEN